MSVTKTEYDFSSCGNTAEIFKTMYSSLIEQIHVAVAQWVRGVGVDTGYPATEQLDLTVFMSRPISARPESKQT